MLRTVFGLLLACVFLSGCNNADRATVTANGPRSVALPTDDDHTQRLVATHYFGNHWAKNFINAFRREDVRGDFQRIREDGFNAVVLVVSWGDFQPVFEPCCEYDPRAFERLRFLLDEAKAAQLKVILRVGFAWTFHPNAGGSLWRLHRLMNEPSVRAAYLKFAERIAAEVADHKQVVMSFGSWEDLPLQHIEPSASADYAEFLASLPSADPLHAVQSRVVSAGAAFPDNSGANVELFQRYWDWLLIEKFFKPVQARIPNYSFEVRIDKEPLPMANGETHWLGHERTFSLPQAQAVTIYWAPFWGARNQGEQLRANESLPLLNHLLESVAAVTNLPVFIDQMNIIDNTPGFENNAVIRADELPAFLAEAACLLRKKKVLGYSLWTGRDYRESLLFNPTFGYGLDGWTYTPSAAAATAVEALPSGDFQLRLNTGSALSQIVSDIRGRLLYVDQRRDQICVEAIASETSRLELRLGANAPSSALTFHADTKPATLCTDLTATLDAGQQSLQMKLQSGNLALRDVQVFDHVQSGGIYDDNGKALSLHDPVRAMNLAFLAKPPPARCAL